jgi:hypothetical protein
MVSQKMYAWGFDFSEVSRKSDVVIIAQEQASVT